jgi:ATP-binding protein involved in chromosome partitioning
MNKVVAVASGKGGVGKSTVATNLAVALANDGSNRKVALIDLDFYGPSIPTLMGGGELKVDHNEKIIPAQRYGVKYVSLGFFLRNDDDPVIWRGPMFGKAIQQLFHDVNWGEVDVAIVDMPPGTGDAQLSLAQMIQLAGAVVVSTPQEVALADVRRAITMFGKLNVPILGIVENMAGFITPSGERFDIFGSGGGAELSKRYELPILAQLPIEMAIREGGDSGVPVAHTRTTASAEIFYDLAATVLAQLELAAASSAPSIANE